MTVQRYYLNIERNDLDKIVDAELAPSKLGAWVSFYEVEPLLAQPNLRDHFAGLAMQSIFGPVLMKAKENGETVDPALSAMVAVAAYKMADAMLSERDK